MAPDSATPCPARMSMGTPTAMSAGARRSTRTATRRTLARLWHWGRACGTPQARPSRHAAVTAVAVHAWAAVAGAAGADAGPARRMQHGALLLLTSAHGQPASRAGCTAHQGCPGCFRLNADVPPLAWHPGGRQQQGQQVGLLLRSVSHAGACRQERLRPGHPGGGQR